MDIVKLRKLTRKSVIPFGKWKGFTVQYVIERKKSALWYLYYNVEWITFTDEILEEIYIGEHRRIQKPGIDRAGVSRIFAEIKASKSPNKYAAANAIQKRIIEKNEKASARKRLSRAVRDEEKTRLQLQAINHGHKKS